MAFENLSERLQKALRNLTGKGKISEEDINAASREIRLALLEADVNFKVVKDFIKTIKKRALGQEVQESLTPGQQVIKIVNEELTKMMGEEAVGLTKSPHIPTVIMMVGLQGTGKTTTVGKLAYRLMKEEKARPFLIAGDIYRPAAIDQLKQIGADLKVPVYSDPEEKSVAKIVEDGLAEAAVHRNDYVIIDTAGRLEIDEPLMKELEEVKAVSQPDNILLVVDAMTGQAAADVAKTFNERLDVTGVILTKLDGEHPGRGRLVYQSHHRQANPLHWARGKADRPGSLPPGPDGFQNPGHGGHADLDRKGPTGLRCQAGGKSCPEDAGKHF